MPYTDRNFIKLKKYSKNIFKKIEKEHFKLM